MEIFADLSHDTGHAFAAFLKSLTMDDYKRHLPDEESAGWAATAGAEILWALRDLGFVTT